MKNIIKILLLTVLLQPLHVEATVLYAQVNDWFDVPKVGEVKKPENPIRVMFWRADKWRSSSNWRYQPHISSREYLDCSYYKYVNCEDIRFCRCWQCKDYNYDFVIVSP